MDLDLNSTMEARRRLGGIRSRLEKDGLKIMPSTHSDIGRYAIAPEWLLDADISDRAVRLFAVLASKFADRDTGVSFPSRQTLANSLRCSVDSIDRALKELNDIGALVIERRRQGKEWLTSTYLVVYARPPGRNLAATGSREVAAQNQRGLNQNQYPDKERERERQPFQKNSETG